MRTVLSERPTAARGGFTLAEILVVILVMSGMLVSITQVLAMARETRDQVHNIQENQLAGPAILDLVERDLRSIFVYGRPAQDALRVLDRTISGRDGDRIDFITATDNLIINEDTSNDVFLASDYNEVGYVLRESRANDDFLEIYRREAFGVDEEPFDGGRYTFLHDRVRNFNIEVFENDDTTEEEAEPLEEWDAVEQTGLPARVEITLTLELAPRLTRETLKLASVDKRTVEYRRVIRFPEYLRQSLGIEPVPLVPEFAPVPSNQLGGGLAGGPGGGDGQGGPGGAGGQGGQPGGAGGGSAGGLGDIFGGGGGGGIGGGGGGATPPIPLGGG